MVFVFDLVCGLDTDKTPLLAQLVGALTFLTYYNYKRTNQKRQPVLVPQRPLFLLALTESDPLASTVLVDELDTGSF